MIVLVGLLARLAYVVWYPQEPVVFDAAGYDQAAEALNNGERDASVRGPVYPAFLAATYKAFGHSYAAVRIAQALLVSVTALLTFVLARSIFDRDRGLVAASLVSFYPGFLFYSGLLLTETVFALLLTLFVVCVVQAQRRGGFGWATGCGVALGFATMCRMEIIGVAVLVAAWFVWKRPAPRGVKQALIMLIVTALTVAPWALRQRAGGRTVAPTLGLGETLWLSTYPEDWPEWYENREPLRSLLDCNCSSEELQARLVRAAMHNVEDSPGQYIKMSAKRFGRFWMGSHSMVVRGLEPSFRRALGNGDVAVLVAKTLLLIVNMVLIALGFAGMYTERASWQAWFPLVLVIGFINFAHVVLFSTSRYQIPIIPLVLVLAAPVAHRLVFGPHARQVI